MSLKKFEQTGERFIPTQSTPVEVIVNMDRYVYALEHCIDKNVLELGFGSGLGAYLYHLVAKKYTGIDYHDDAFAYTKQYPFNRDSGLAFVRMDLEKSIPGGEFDVTVAMEILEHLEDPGKLLRGLDTKKLVFSFPLSSMAVSKWHKFPIRGDKAGIKDIHKFIEDNGYDTQDISLQAGRWVMGWAKKK